VGGGSVENGLFRQHHGHSRTAAVAKPNNDVKNDAHYFGKWFNVLHSTQFTHISSK
jgi:hypothetical protein